MIHVSGSMFPPSQELQKVFLEAQLLALACYNESVIASVLTHWLTRLSCDR
jgi:hypothetical protein